MELFSLGPLQNDHLGFHNDEQPKTLQQLVEVKNNSLALRSWCQSADGAVAAPWSGLLHVPVAVSQAHFISRKLFAAATNAGLMKIL